MTVYFLGGGNMAAAIIAGMVRHGGYAIHVVGRNAAKQQQLAERYGVAISPTLPALSADDVLVLAVKPQDMKAACENVATNGALVLSVAAGLSVDTLSRYLGGTRRIVRVMPNTPSKIGLGVSGMYAAEGLSESDKQIAEVLMQSAGMVVWLAKEDEMHSITGISGSGSAYVFYLMGALERAAKQQGFGDEQAKRLSLATFKGAVALAEQSGEAFAVLQQNVTSKGGTTAEAIRVFDEKDIPESIAEGVAACVARSKEIGKMLESQ